MKTAVSLIFWTIFGAIALTAAFTGHAVGWVGTVIAGLGIKHALWPSKENAEFDETRSTSTAVVVAVVVVAVADRGNHASCLPVR